MSYYILPKKHSTVHIHPTFIERDFYHTDRDDAFTMQVNSFNHSSKSSNLDSSFLRKTVGDLGIEKPPILLKKKTDTINSFASDINEDSLTQRDMLERIDTGNGMSPEEFSFFSEPFGTYFVNRESLCPHKNYLTSSDTTATESVLYHSHSHTRNSQRTQLKHYISHSLIFYLSEMTEILDKINSDSLNPSYFSSSELERGYNQSFPYPLHVPYITQHRTSMDSLSIPGRPKRVSDLSCMKELYSSSTNIRSPFICNSSSSPNMNSLYLADDISFVPRTDGFCELSGSLNSNFVMQYNDYSDAQLNTNNGLKIDEFIPDRLYSILNPYSFVFSKVPGSNLSVSKLKPDTNLFYILLEVISSFTLLQVYSQRSMKTLHFGPESSSTIECLNMLREDYDDTNYSDRLDSTVFHKLPYIEDNTVDFIFFELEDYNNISHYITGLIVILCNIVTYLNTNGSCVIKIDTIYYKPIIDILFSLTGLFEKVYIIKPNTSPIYQDDRYIVCKHFISTHIKKATYKQYLATFSLLLDNMKCNNKIIESLVPHDLPSYFLNKIEDSNIIIGQQKLDLLDQMANIIKSKNRNDKIEALKKNNIIKCIQWCDKFKIPYNKFVGKLNIFLNPPYNSVDSENDRDTDIVNDAIIIANIENMCETTEEVDYIDEDSERNVY